MNNEIITLENVLDLDRETMVLEYQLMSLDYEVLQEEGKFKQTLDKIIKWFKDMFQKIADFFRTVTAKLFARFANLHKAYAKAMKLQNANKIEVEVQASYIKGIFVVSDAAESAIDSCGEITEQESGSNNAAEILSSFNSLIKEKSSDTKSKVKLSYMGEAIKGLDQAKGAYTLFKSAFGRMSGVSKRMIQKAKATENAALLANTRAGLSTGRSILSAYNKYINRATVEVYRVLIGAKSASKGVKSDDNSAEESRLSRRSNPSSSSNSSTRYDVVAAESFGFDDGFNEGFDFESDFGFDDNLIEGVDFHMGGLVL